MQIHKKVSKQTLYFNKYKYSINFNLGSSYIIRKCATMAEAELAFGRALVNEGISLRRQKTSIADEINLLREFMKWRTSFGQDNRYCFTYGSVKVYSNDLSVLDFVNSCIGYMYCTITEIEDVSGSNTILRKNPKFKHRIYCKPTYVTPELLEQLYEIQTQYGDAIKLSPGILLLANRWAKFKVYRRPYRKNANIFIDYNDEGIALMLQLTLDAMFKSSIKIEKVA